MTISDHDRANVLGCGILGSIAAILAAESFRENSWAKWRKSPTLMECLPLPPPIGCTEHQQSKEILGEDETDFAWFSLLSVFPAIVYLISCLLVYSDNNTKLSRIEELATKKTQLSLILTTAMLNILSCAVAVFRINIVSSIARRPGLFTTSGLIPVYSSSYYLSVGAALFSLIAAVCTNQITFESSRREDKRLFKTVKQHMARNLMYPGDQKPSKMVTFSSMEPHMEEAAAELCVRAVMQFSLEEDIAENIKQEFEARFGPTWHCAVGSNFGSAVHHKVNEYIEIALPQLSILLFRCDKPVKLKHVTCSNIN